MFAASESIRSHARVQFDDDGGGGGGGGGSGVGGGTEMTTLPQVTTTEKEELLRTKGSIKRHEAIIEVEMARIAELRASIPGKYMQ